jgi:hypothetical protein
LRGELCGQRMPRRLLLVVAAALVGTLAPRTASAESLFDLLFGGPQKKQQRTATSRANLFADPLGLDQRPAPPQRSSSFGPAFCVRSCDGRYFPLAARGGASPVQMCQAFCPASPTRVFFGSNIENATSINGERYVDSENAFIYRKAMRDDCTCNGRGPAGLAPVDLTLDTSLRAGDVIATTNGLVAYSGVKAGVSQNPDFTPIASYRGLSAEVRARLGEMKVAPIAAEMTVNDVPLARPNLM